jgi:hypothetical protein
MNDLPDIESLLGCKGQWTYINPEIVKNDHRRYQRILVPHRVRTLMQEIQEGVEHENLLIIARRLEFKGGGGADYSYWAINGQHHLLAYALLGIPVVPVFLVEAGGYRAEKALFFKFQKWQAENGKASDTEVRFCK